MRRRHTLGGQMSESREAAGIVVSGKRRKRMSEFATHIADATNQ
jgi:hypothetical protein